MDRPSDPASEETIAFDAAAVAVGASTGASIGPAISSSQLSRISHTSLPEDGRFAPGTLLGGRYRILGLLGRGGMGEVYRATDLLLGQAVALKFLPETTSGNPRLLERFFAEVRIARQVSHPNVCRVYDIGEIDGVPFLSMEYIDGEDLASLLTRIGRLPADKALEAARKLCAGLAAAHDCGVIHRDLKPANIMINKRGNVVIMDFGLAAIADELSGAEARNGTPAYMSPEQLRGTGVTARSDIYALGLVFYELFTGKKPFEAASLAELMTKQESVDLTSLSSLATDADPQVERVIRRCLDPEPSKRPPTALAVAAALPGGDPLAAALAAGEMPSPEMVANAGATEGLRRGVAVGLFAVVLATLGSSVFFRQQLGAMQNAPLDYPPPVLAQKAREMAASFGYERRPADFHIRMRWQERLLEELRKKPKPHPAQQWLQAEAPIVAEYREASAPIAADPDGYVRENRPPLDKPGMISVTLNGYGRLRSFAAVPDPALPALPAPDPRAVFAAAGLSLDQFQVVPNQTTPPVPADVLTTWTGRHPGLPDIPLTVEAGWWRGHLTYFRARFPWQKPAGVEEPQSASQAFAQNLGYLVALVGVTFAGLLARRNWRQGRGDRRGALRVAAALFLLTTARELLVVHVIPTADLIDYLVHALAIGLFLGGAGWVLYLALEPALRSRWPHSIVTWNRLLAGRWSDPLVQSHILIGMAIGAVSWLVATGTSYLDDSWEPLSVVGNISSGVSLRLWLANLVQLAQGALQTGLILFFTLFGFKVLLKRDWFAALTSAILFTVLSGALSAPSAKVTVPVILAIYLMIALVLLRSGLVTVIGLVFGINLMGINLLGMDPARWWGGYGLAALLLHAGMATYAFAKSLGGRELLEDTGPRPAPRTAIV